MSDLVIVTTTKKEKLKVQKHAPLSEVAEPEPGRFGKAQQVGFTVTVAGTTFSFIPEENEQRIWLSAFRTAKAAP